METPKLVIVKFAVFLGDKSRWRAKSVEKREVALLVIQRLARANHVIFRTRYVVYPLVHLSCRCRTCLQCIDFRENLSGPETLPCMQHEAWQR